MHGRTIEAGFQEMSPKSIHTTKVFGGAVAVVASAVALTALPLARASQVTELKSEVSDTKAAIDDMHRQAEESSERIHALEGEIEGLNGELEAAQSNLADARAKLARNCQIGYKSGISASPVEVILGAETLDDAVTGMQYANSIRSSMTDGVKEVNEERSRLDSILVERQASIDEERRAKEDLDRQVEELNQRLDSLNAEMRNAINASMNSIAADANAVYEAAMVEINDDPTRKALIDAAYSQIGVPYGYGSYAPGSSLDCSGFIMYAYSQIGVSLPHSSVSQNAIATHKDLTELLPGDLLFWVGTSSGSGSGSHVAMYLGNGKIIHASWEGVLVQNIYGGWNSCGSVI